MLKGKFTHKIEKKAGLKRQAFLDSIMNEALEDAYTFNDINAAVSYLTSKYDLGFNEIKYIKDSMAKLNIKK